MPFSKSVPLSRLISLLTRSIPAKWIRLVCLLILFAVVISSLPVHLKYDGANAQSSGPRRSQGPPSRNLPNLNDARGIETGTPRIMPPVPATKCRGRDEKCKKAKGKISSNLPDNQDRLPAYADYRSRRDYAGWLKIAIPALSMLDDLIYGSARMISDFPDMSYRSRGDLLAGSAVKGANPRNESYGGAGGNLAVSGDFTFTTPDTTAPVISNVAAGGITTTSATITWTTNENSDSQVEYGLTTAYGQSTTLNPALVTAHSQGLSGLSPGTVYHYRVKSKDAAGNLAVSGDFLFPTQPLPPPDTTTPPQVTSFAPAAGATYVDTLANVTVTFASPIGIDAATVNGSTIELRDPSNALVSATVKL